MKKIYKKTLPKMYTVITIPELELIYSILREKHPNNKIHITFDYNTKKYTINVSEEKFEGNPDIPVDVDITCIYGDSVVSDTPILLRDKKTKQVYIKEIGNISNNWSDYPEFKIFDKSVRLEKSFATTDLQVYNDLGWTDIKKIIRHKTNKKIYRVSTNTGIVDVTEDHSLMNDKYEKVKPTEVKVGDSLAHSFPKDFTEIDNFDNILNAKKSIKQNYILQYIWENNTNPPGSPFKNEFVYDNKIEAQEMYYILMNLFDSGVEIEEIENKYIMKIRVNSCSESKENSQIRKIEYLRDSTLDEYVYDIETENGRFNCGIGSIIVRNTDSIFLKVKYNLNDFEKNRKDTFELATLCGNKITNEYFNRHPIELEFEKIFQPFILLTKKRYIANKYDNPKKPFDLKGVDSKGIATKRRDYCKYVQKCYQEIIDSVMLDYTEEGLKRNIEIFKKYINNIETYNVNIEDLVVSSLLAKSYKTNPVHVILANKLKERHEEVQVGTRIPYIYIESDDPKQAKSELGEDPDYAVKNGLKFNRWCYLEQMSKPILSFFSVVLHDDQALLNEILDYTNERLLKWGGKKLKHSDLKIEPPTGEPI